MKTKSNIDQVKTLMSTWIKQPLFERTEAKTSSLLALTDREERTKKRFNELTSTSHKTHQLVHVSGLDGP